MAVKHTTIDIDWKVNTNELKASVQMTDEYASKASQGFKSAQRSVDRLGNSQAAVNKVLKSAQQDYQSASQSMDKYRNSTKLSATELKQLRQDTENYEKRLASSQRQINLITKEGNSYTTMLKAQGHQHAARSAELASLRGTYVSLQTQYQREALQLERIKIRSGETSKAYLNQKIKLNELGTQIANASSKLNGFNRAQKSMKSAFESANRVYDKTKALSLGVGAAFVYGAKKAIELQHEYKVTNNLLTTGGESARTSMRATKQMQADGAKYSIQYGKSQKSIAEGYQELTKRGYTSEQSLGSMKSMLKASVASGDSFSDVVHDSTAALESFGMRASSTAGMIKNTKTVTNQMAYAADLTATDFHSMGIALSYSGVSAKQAGLSLSETASAIGILSNNGLEADKAGTGLRKTLTSLQSPSKAAQGALDKLGLSTKDFTKKNGDMKSMADTFSLIQQHSAKLGATEKASVFHNLFGATGQQAGAILAENADQLGKLNEKVKDSAKNDYTGKLSAKNMQSAQNQINKFKQAASGLAITFAQTVLPSITKLAIGMGGLLEKFGKLDKSQKTMLTWTAISVAALAPAAKVVSVITTLDSAAIKTAKFVKGLAVSQDALAASSTALAESEGAAGATSSVSSATTGKIGKLSASSLVSKLAYAGIGLSVGNDVVKAIHSGVDSKQGGKELWHGAGSAVGGGVAAALSGGNPLVATIGAAVGGAIGNAIADSPIVKQVNKTERKNIHSYDANAKKSGSASHQTLRTNPYGSGAGNDISGLSVGSSKKKDTNGSKSSKKSAKKDNPFDSLPKDARTATQTATQLVSSANKDWANAAADFSMKQTKKIKNDESSLLASNSAKYNKAYSALSGYVDKSTSKSTKAASFLEKIGATSASSAHKALSSQQSYNQKHLAAVKADYAAIERDERNGGKNRVALVQKLNADILRLTDKGNQKQQALRKRLNSQTTKLTSKQYSSVISQSAKAYSLTKSNAKKTYNAQVSSADKRYNQTLKSAKQLYGVHSAEYKRIKGYAQDQYDKTTSAAHDQYKKTVHWAEKQRDAVVQAAADAAGGINGIMGVMSNNLETMLNQNSSATGSKHQKPVSDTKSIKNNYNPGNKLAKAAGKTYMGSGITVNQGLPGKATGGAIRKTSMAMVGENGSEILQRGKQFSVVGARGAQLLQVRSGDRIYNHADVTKMARGSFGQRLPNFAAGTTQLTSFAAGSGAAMPGLSKKTSKDSISESKKMSKSVTKNYGDMSKKSASSLKQLNKKNASLWHDTRTDAESETTKLHKQAVKKFDDVKDDTVASLKSMHKQFNSVTTDLVSDFGSIFGKLKGQAHDGMAGAISSMNSGISSIDTTLAQFGGNKSVLKPIHYATGSKGPIASDQLAVLNDATSGPRQELVARGSQLLKPIGKDVITPLKKGDEVFNGSQVEKAKPYLPHFKKGTGASDDKLISLATKNHKNPDAAWKRDFDDKTIKPKGSDLQRGLTTTAKGATDSVGPNWYKAGWNVISDAINGGSGAGGNWAHSPGSGWSTGGNGQKFGDSRDGGSHDGVDFGAALGTPFHAMHGGVVTRAGNPVWAPGALGKVITVKSDDGYQEIYQEFGGMRNIKVSVGDKVKTGQTLGTLGPLNGAGSGAHLHVGVSHGSLWDHGGTSTRGWYDVTKMHGKSSGVEKSKPKDTGVEKLFKQEIGKSALSWISKRLHVDDDSGSGGTSAAPSGSHKHWLEQAGIPASQFAAYNSIITPESGWNPTIHNPSSSAYGIPQALPGSKMASAGSDWKTNPITQLKWMKSYVNGRYGGIDKALAFRKVHGWYAKGGRPKVGEWSIVGEKGPELFKPDSAGTIYPHEKSKQIANHPISSTSRNGSKPKIDFHPTININIKGDTGGNVTKQQILKWVKEAMGESFEQLQDLLGGA
ncbi:phage tail tape measure protein [Levilactobacillus brevis]|uniref:phage tail tape measure protein n=1 Tax=Levilactobacillus brevis TaxID=1580 RepID=UPI0021A7481E|nr:phage tail tape measure protein [Levilactobacillus brevis]MCT3597553.1 phage tail tape measure protein [Levilactobacillus brevis]